MNLPKTTTVKTSLILLTAAVVLAGFASLAEARPVRVRVRVARHRRVVRPVVRPAPRPVVVRPAPKPVIVRPAPKPIVVKTPVIRPVVTPAVTVTVPAESDAEKALKAEIASEQAKYDSLCRTRGALRNWLAGPGKYRSLDQRAAVQVRLAKLDKQALAVATHIAELEAALAEL